jgi:hypothetical protein
MAMLPHIATLCNTCGMASSLGNKSFQGLGLHPDHARRLDDLARLASDTQSQVADLNARVSGPSVTIATPSVTPSGRPGSITFVNGVLTSHIPGT